MKMVCYCLLALVVILSAAYAQSGTVGHHAQMPLNCKECHLCNTPTYEKPCLKIFPEFTRERGITVHHSAKDAPEILKIEVLSKLYEPSIFTHRLHAEMAGMSGGCVSCHHHNPPGRIAACRECHDPSVSGTDLNKPGLKGAYHRQCLNCHRQWSHSNECPVCHAEKSDQLSPAEISDKAAFKEVKHPVVSEPAKLVYQTEYKDAPIATFYHDAHAERYGLKCVDCHQNESCSRCHDTIKETSLAEKKPHENCIDCHADEVDENCPKCHGLKEKAPFHHSQTGFALGRYHQTLNCQACHLMKKYSAKLNKNCDTCHHTWNSKTFNHQVTGLMLNEDHIDNDCADCHINRDFAAKPQCDGCHDELSYPAQKPGKEVKLID